MQYRRLGGTGLRVSAIGVGSWQLAGPVTIDGKPDGFPEIGRGNAVDLIRACGDLGINLVDCAAIYGDGEGERRVGEALRGRRDQWVVCTKSGMSRGPDGRRVRDFSADGITRAVEGSLSRLGIEAVDVYLLHSPRDRSEVDAALEALGRIREQGKIRHCGLSTNDAALIRTAARAGPLDVVLFSHSLLTPNDEVRAAVANLGIGGLARGVFESGLLSGRPPGQPPRFEADDIRASRGLDEEAARMQPLYDAAGDPAALPELAIRYAIDSSAVHAVVLGGRSIDAYRRAAAAISMPAIDVAQRRVIESMARRVRPPASRRGWAASAKRLMRRALGR